MINANLEQFLDTGWFNEATLYYNGYIYWCEGGINNEMPYYKKFNITVYKFKVNIVDEKYFERIIENNDVSGFEYVLNVNAEDEDAAKKIFLESKIFDGKSFWDVESELAWYDEV